MNDQEISVFDENYSKENSGTVRSKNFPESTSVTAIVHNSRYNHLDVTFKSGKTYRYSGVTRSVADPFFSKEQFSAGKLVQDILIKGKYAYTVL